MSKSKKQNNSSPEEEASQGSITLEKLIPVMGTCWVGIVIFALYAVSGK